MLPLAFGIAAGIVLAAGIYLILIETEHFDLGLAEF